MMFFLKKKLKITSFWFKIKGSKKNLVDPASDQQITRLIYLIGSSFITKYKKHNKHFLPEIKKKKLQKINNTLSTPKLPT
jgi:hypothetical protein